MPDSLGFVRIIGAAAISTACAAPALQPGSETLVKARLLADSQSLVPGQVALLGFAFDLKPGWHLYWDGQNTSGSPIIIKPALPHGFDAGPLLWPAPKRHVLPGEIVDYVYDEPVTLVLAVHVPADAEIGSTARISADVQWVVCEKVCIFGRDEVSIELPVFAQAPSASPDSARIREALAHVPRPLDPDTDGVTARLEGNRLAIVVSGAESLTFFPGPDCSPPVNILGEGERRGTSLSVELAAGRDEPVRASGILEVRRTAADRLVYWIELPDPSRALDPDAVVSGQP